MNKINNLNEINQNSNDENLNTTLENNNHIDFLSYGKNLAVRESQKGKGCYDLISPFALHRVALRCELGAEKYRDGRNWEKGMPFSRYINSTLRHINQYRMGINDEDNLAAAVWNLLAIMHHEELGQVEFNDLPNYKDNKNK